MWPQLQILIVAWKIINMQDMVTKCYWYTLTNNRGGVGSNKSWLDRVLVNDICLDSFQDADIGHASGISDQCALVLSIVHKHHKAVPFRFYNFWMNNEGFKDLLAHFWFSEKDGNSMDRLS